MRPLALFSVSLTLLFVPFFGFAQTLPTSAGFLNDVAGVLTPRERAALEAKLTAFEESTNHEIAIAIVPDLSGDTVEGFAVRLFEAWGIGKAKADNGVLILVAIAERAMRIEVGYGLEGALTDSQSFWIIERVMKPAFQAGDFSGGLNGAVDNIIAATEGEVIPSVSPRTAFIGKFVSDIFYFIPFIFIWFASILGRSKSWWAGGVVGGVFGLILGFIFGFLYTGIVAAAILIPFGLLFDYLASRAYARSAMSGGHIPWWVGGHRRGPWGGGGFGGFGGGRSGGGGSSGRW